MISRLRAMLINRNQRQTVVELLTLRALVGGGSNRRVFPQGRPSSERHGPRPVALLGKIHATRRVGRPIWNQESAADDSCRPQRSPQQRTLADQSKFTVGSTGSPPLLPLI